MEQVRERKPTNTAESSSDSMTATLEDKVVQAVVEHPMAKKILPYLEMARPYAVKATALFDQLEPYFELVWKKLKQIWQQLLPYHPEEFIPALFGLCLVFFGGQYMTLIAAIEAYRICGWTETKTCLMQLYKDYKIVKAANDKDNKVDDNDDGIPDVEQISSKELASRKVKLILKSCNPERVSGALSGIYNGFLAVIATLRIQFAQTITVGISLGEMFTDVSMKYMQPILQNLIPAEYHKWIPTIIRYGCRSMGVSIAWFIQRIISGFYSAMRGAQIFVRGTLSFMQRNHFAPPIKEDSATFTLIVSVVAMIGFLWQFSMGFSLPFPLNVLLLPVTLVEYFLEYMVAVHN